MLSSACRFGGTGRGPGSWSVDLLLLPYGTALGVYALWVLLNEEGKKLFAENG